jgi:hypothetical protein
MTEVHRRKVVGKSEVIRREHRTQGTLAVDQSRTTKVNGLPPRFERCNVHSAKESSSPGIPRVWLRILDDLARCFIVVVPIWAPWWREPDILSRTRNIAPYNNLKVMA